MNKQNIINIPSWNLSFFSIGKTKESTEGGDFKRYIGVGSSKVLAVNPTKEQLDELMGYESSAPEYTGSDDNGEYARITFVMQTDDPTGIDIKNRVTFMLHKAPAYNRDQTKVQVIDAYGNTTWANTEDAKAGKKLLSAAGNPLKIADKYRMAVQGEADLVGFLKAYLCVDDAFDYKNGAWILKPNASDYVFSLDKIKDYFKGDFSEIKEVIKLQPNNKVKLLYGVRSTDDGKQYQTVATRSGMVLRNSAGARAYERLEKELNNAKANGAYANTEFKVQELQEFNVEPTNLNQPAEDSSDMPWN